MATLQKAFPFTTDLEGFVPTGGNADTTLEWASVGGNPGGCVSSRIFGRNKSADPTWDWDGTWEDLGVPAGATVTHAQIWCDWRCSEWNVGNTLTEFRYAAISDAAASVISQANGSAVSGTTAYATIAGSQGAVASGYGDSTDAVNIGVDLYLRNANDAAAAVTLLFDNVVVEVTYTQGGTTYTKTVLVAASAIPLATRKGLFARTAAALASVVPSVSLSRAFSRVVQAVASIVPSVGVLWTEQVYPSLRLKVFTTKRRAASVWATALAYKEAALIRVSVAVSALAETRAYRVTSRTFHAAAAPIARVTRSATRYIRVAANALPSVLRRTARAFTVAASVVASALVRAFVGLTVRAVASVSSSVSRSASRTFRAASSVVSSVSRFTSRTLRAVASAVPRAMKGTAQAVRAVAAAVPSVATYLIEQGKVYVRAVAQVVPRAAKAASLHRAFRAVASVVPGVLARLLEVYQVNVRAVANVASRVQTYLVELGKVYVRATAAVSGRVSRHTSRVLRAVTDVASRVRKSMAVAVRVAASVVARAVASIGRFVNVRAVAAVGARVVKSTRLPLRVAANVVLGVSRRASRAFRAVGGVVVGVTRLTALTLSHGSAVRARMYRDAARVVRSIKRVAATMEERVRLVGNRARALLEGSKDKNDLDGRA